MKSLRSSRVVRHLRIQEWHHSAQFTANLLDLVLPPLRALFQQERSTFFGLGKPLMSEGALYRLLAWWSPSYPVGAFSYSHGIEWVVETGEVHDEETLRDWVDGLPSTTAESRC